MIAAGVTYIVNAVWQTPLIFLTVEVLIRLVRMPARMRCWVWRTALALAVCAPIVGSSTPSSARGSVSAFFGALKSTHAPGLVLERGVGEFLVGGALAFVVVAVLRLVSGLIGVWRLTRCSRPYPLDGRLQDRLAAYAADLGVASPAVLISTELRVPVLVGWRRPVVLAPTSFPDLNEEQVLAALMHETAHAARRDYALNLALEALSLPLSWHPMLTLVRNRIHTAREFACDELAAAALPGRYARRLVELARVFCDAHGRPPGFALGLIGRGELERRVDALLRSEMAPVSRPSVTASAATLVIFAAIGTISALLHVSPTLRFEDAPEPAPVTPSATTLGAPMPEGKGRAVTRAGADFLKAGQGGRTRRSRLSSGVSGGVFASHGSLEPLLADRAAVQTARDGGRYEELVAVKPEPDGARMLYRLVLRDDGRVQALQPILLPMESRPDEVKITIA